MKVKSLEHCAQLKDRGGLGRADPRMFSLQGLEAWQTNPGDAAKLPHSTTYTLSCMSPAS